MQSFDLAIFDFDGTLGDSVGWFAEIVNQVAREFRFREVDAEEAERLRSTPPPPTRPLLRKRPEKLSQLTFFVGDRRRVEALSRAVLTDHSAGSAFGDPEPVAQHRHCCAFAVRG